MWQAAASGLVLAAAWAGLRWRAGALRSWWPPWVVALDALPLALGLALFAALTARPLLGALLVAALAGGLVGADTVKREVLREPVVFADRAELLELVRHPGFYFPFVGLHWVALCAAMIVAAVGLAAWAVPPLWAWTPWPPLIAAALAGAALAGPGWPPLLARLRRAYEALGPTRDPEGDMARFGMLACFAIHATIARAERPARLAAPAVLLMSARSDAGPVVMAQLESFFDPRRLHEAIPRDLLPGWDACVGESRAYGRLGVPTWGANTIRSEFAALTGVGREALGLDWFNPYERFARRRVDSVAWRMRAAGRRAICLHPFDKRFYGRHRAMPALGFERFVGPEAFSRAERDGAYVSDAALARKAAEIVADEGAELFLFVISVGNHGPWAADAASPAPAALADIPEAGALGAYLAGLRGTDAFFPPVTAALRAAARPGVLLAYGDHQPSLPAAFAALRHGDSDTDYVLWTAEGTPGGAGREGRTMQIHDLPALLQDALADASHVAELAR